MLSKNFSRYWHYVCRSSAPLHPHQVFHYVSLTNVPNTELMSPTGATRTAVAFVEKRRKPATTLRSLINCTAHQKTAKLANTPVIAHLLRNLLYRSNNSRLCYLFAYNYCSLRYCGKQSKIKLKTFRPLRNEITKHQ